MQVSIIVPIYNVESYLDECLTSIINQTHTNLDIILIDDGSTDNSLQIALKYAKLDKRILVISKPNDGQSSAKNLGLELIKGTQLREILENSNIQAIESYITSNSLDKTSRQITKDKIMSHFIKKDSNYFETTLENPHTLLIQNLPNTLVKFVDSDDYLALNHIETLLKQIQKLPLQKQENLIVSHNFLEIKDGKSTPMFFCSPKHLSLEKMNASTPNQALNYLSRGIYLFYFAWCGIFNASILNQYNLRHIPQIISEDIAFGTILFMLQGNYLHINDYGYHYRIRNDSTMTQLTSNTGDIRKGVKAILHYFNTLQQARQYYLSYSIVINAIAIYSAANSLPIDNHLKSNIQNTALKSIMEYYIVSKNITQDFLNVIPLLKAKNIYEPLKAYTKNYFFNLRSLLRHPRKIVKAFLFNIKAD